MSIDDSLQPKWKHSNWEVRLAAVAELTDQALLADIAKNDEAPSVRAAAVERVTDQSVLADIAKNDWAWPVRKAAVERVTDQSVLADIAKNDASSTFGRPAWRLGFLGALTLMKYWNLTPARRKLRDIVGLSGLTLCVLGFLGVVFGGLGYLEDLKPESGLLSAQQAAGVFYLALAAFVVGVVLIRRATRESSREEQRVFKRGIVWDARMKQFLRGDFELVAPQAMDASSAPDQARAAKLAGVREVDMRPAKQAAAPEVAPIYAAYGVREVDIRPAKQGSVVPIEVPDPELVITVMAHSKESIEVASLMLRSRFDSCPAYQISMSNLIVDNQLLSQRRDQFVQTLITIGDAIRRLPKQPFAVRLVLELPASERGGPASTWGLVGGLIIAADEISRAKLLGGLLFDLKHIAEEYGWVLTTPS